jgi:hypothetical protein
VSDKISGGYDAPISAAVDDLLNRAPFAQEIAHIASRCPGDWSVRIGVYGNWGTGKTSALRLVESLLEPEVPVVWFNPWGHADQDAMWASFVQTVFQRLATADRTVHGATWDKVKRSARGLLDTVEKMAKIRKETEVALSLGTPWLGEWLKASAEDLEGLTLSLGGKRVVVILDDVDRVDPKLLPSLFFALQELLDLPGFSFILSLDPKVVGKALGEYHKGWGDGEEFLEKIIDFPRRLPDPTSKDLWRLASTDLRRYCGFLALEFVERDFKLLPSNPRRLRMFIRHLWSLETQVARHRTDELDLACLVLLALFRFSWPELASVVLSSDELLQGMAMMRIVDSKSPSLKRTIDQVETTTKSILKDASDHEVQRATALMKALGESWTMLSPSDVRRHAYLAERPSILTRKEFEEMLNLWRNDSDTQRAWIATHSARVGHNVPDVSRALFQAALRHSHSSMGLAAGSRDGAGLVEAVAMASACWRLAKSLWLGANLRAQKGVFEPALDGAFRWAHFRNHDAYRSLRKLEEDTVLAFARDLKGDRAVEAYKLVLPSFFTSATERQEQALTLRDSVRDALGEALLERGLATLKIQGGFRQIFRNEDLQGLQHIMLNHAGPLWSGLGRVRALELINSEGSSAAVRPNLEEFLHMFEDDHVRLHGYAWATVDQINSLYKDAEIVELIWRQVLATEVNPRFRSGLVDLARHFGKHTGIVLAIPDWWGVDTASGQS